MLDAQIKILKEQMNILKTEEGDFQDKQRFLQSDLARASKENNRVRLATEDECRDLVSNGDRAETVHYEHKMTQDKELAFDQVFEERH